MTIPTLKKPSNRKRRGFTLLELVVALVVLGILAALAIPTYTTVIGNAKTAVATSEAISVATDAVAIASGHNIYATEAQFTLAIAEDPSAHVAIASPDTYSNGGTATSSATSTITLAVTENGGTYDVALAWLDQVNSAPYATSTTEVSGGSGGSDATTTTTSTTTTSTTTTTTTVPTTEYAYVTNASSDAVSVINTATDANVGDIGVGNNPEGVAVSPDGKTIYVANNGDGTISVINASSGLVTNTIPTLAGDYNVTNVAVTPDGSELYVSDGSNIKVLNASSGALVATIPVGSGASQTVFSPDGTTAYVADAYASEVSVIDVGTNALTTTITSGDFSGDYSLALSPNGSTLYVANQFSNTLTVVNTGTDAVTANVTVGNGPYSVLLNASGSTAYTANFSDSTVSVIDTGSDTVSTISLDSGFSPMSLALDASGNFLYVGGYSSYVETIALPSDVASDGASTHGDNAGIVFASH